MHLPPAQVLRGRACPPTHGVWRSPETSAPSLKSLAEGLLSLFGTSEMSPGHVSTPRPRAVLTLGELELERLAR